MVEFALTASVFLFAIGGGLELMRLGFYALTYQMLAVQAARCGGIVGACGVRGAADGTTRARELVDLFASATGAPGRYAQPYGVAVQQGNICLRVVGPSGAPSSCNPANSNTIDGSNSIGDPRDENERLFFVRIERTIPLAFGLGSYTVRGEAFGTNEPPELG